MENNSNAIAEIQKKYAGCNLLMPAATEVQLNPFYKITVMEVTADLSENSGDIFKVGSVKTGTTQQGKDIWEETYSPAKPLLMKIAAAAGIQFDPDHTYGTKIDANTYKAKAYGAITKFVDSKGKLKSHSERENWKRFRIVPSAKILSCLLLERKKYLIGKGIDKGYLMDCPIILENECISDMKKGKEMNHCRPGKISSISNELIQVAGIPKNEIILPDERGELITDLNRYHGDIFLSNFRHKANHVAYLTIGEINYMIGIDAPDTFSRHYCDYSNDFLQKAIIQKLRRWEYGYENMATEVKYS